MFSLEHVLNDVLCTFFHVVAVSGDCGPTISSFKNEIKLNMINITIKYGTYNAMPLKILGPVRIFGNTSL